MHRYSPLYAVHAFELQIAAVSMCAEVGFPVELYNCPCSFVSSCSSFPHTSTRPTLALRLQVLLQFAQRLVPVRDLVLLDRIHLGVPTQVSIPPHNNRSTDSRQAIALVRLEDWIPAKYLVPARRNDLALGLALEQDDLGRRVFVGWSGRVGERAERVGAGRGESLEERVEAFTKASARGCSSAKGGETNRRGRAWS